jgi:predicted methyltransferase
MLAAVRRSLQPDGRLVVIEYSEHRFGPTDTKERLTVEQLRAEIEPVGFDLDRALDILPFQNALIFTKRP